MVTVVIMVMVVYNGYGGYGSLSSYDVVSLVRHHVNNLVILWR